MDEAHFLSLTDYNATLTDGTRVKIVQPFLEFYGKEYIVSAQYIRCGRLFLQCVDESRRRIITVPASFTDYIHDPFLKADVSDLKFHFTVEALREVNSIVNDALTMSTS